MKNKGGIIALVIAFVLISAYFLLRTWKVNAIRSEAEAYAMTKDGKVDPSKKQSYLDSLWKTDVFLGSTLEDLTKQELGLGLDLQGGMSVILEVSSTEIVKSLASASRDPKVAIAVENAKKISNGNSSNFVDLFASEYKKIAPDTKLASVFSNSTNRDKINSTSSDSEVIKFIKSNVDDAFKNAFRVIQNRVDKFGVANPNIQVLPNTNRIQVELPGVDNPQRVRKLLSGSAKLEFCEVYEVRDLGTAFDQLSAILVKMDLDARADKVSNKIAAKADTANTLASKLGAAKSDSSKVDTSAQNSAFSSLFVSVNGGLGVRTRDSSKLNAILKRPDVQLLFPSDLSFQYDITPVTDELTKEERVAIYMLKDVGNAPLEGNVITNARQDFDQFGKPEVTMQMNPTGARKWQSLTAANVGKRVAIVLDNFVYSAPNINQEISGGNSSISGGFTTEDAIDLANVLKSGKLPAPTNIIEEAIVGASVGSDAASAGIISSLIGILVVLVFVLIYYNKAGFIADLALVINILLLLGVMASFGATLTLPGIAGMVLSVGMSVDANVLIYERIKEELLLGKTFPVAVRDGFKNAMSSIIDSNVTTAITGIVLFVFGTGLILGFATTLLIGIATSLFSAIFITRLIFEYYIGKGKTVTFSTKLTDKLFKDSSFDFVSKRKTYYAISSIIIAAGVVSIFIKGFGLGVDFLGGRTYVAKFEKTIDTDDVKTALAKTFEGSAIEVKTFGGFDQVKITTPYKIENTDTEVEKELETNVIASLASVKGNAGKIQSSSKVGPTIANDAIWSAVKAVLVAILLVFLYIYFRFGRRLAFGYGALVALVHDVAIILGIFSIGRGLLPFSLDVDQAFIGAVLTIMGYSMNDTVVVFDRVREYLTEKRGTKESIPQVINNALNSTLSRTAVTGFSTLLVLLILLIFGGETIRGFVFAMFVGVIVGTYSSLFVATPIVVDGMQRELDLQDKKLTEVALEAKAKK